MTEDQAIRLEGEVSKLDFLVETLNFGELCIGGNEIENLGLQGILKDISANIKVLIEESKGPDSEDDAPPGPLEEKCHYNIE